MQELPNLDLVPAGAGDVVVERATPDGPQFVRNVMAALFRRRRLVIFIFLAVLCASATIALRMPARYESKMKILVKNDRATSVISADSGDAFPNQPEQDEARINSEIQLLESTDVLVEVVKRQGLDELERGKTGYARETESLLIDTALARLQKDLLVLAVKKSDIIEVSYSAEQPSQAADVLKALAETYLEAHLKAHSTPMVQELFQGEAQRLATELAGARQEMAAFRQQHALGSLDMQKELLQREAAQVNQALWETRASLSEKQAQLQQLEAESQTIDREILSEQKVLPNQYSIERLNTMLAELRNQRLEATVKFREDDRVVVQIDEKIANVEKALHEAKNDVSVERTQVANPLWRNVLAELSVTRREMAGLSQRQKQLHASLDSLQGKQAALEAATPAHDALASQIRDIEERYSLHVRKSEEARIESDMDRSRISNVKVVQTPRRPDLPARSNLAMGLLFGLFFGTSLGIAGGLAADRLVGVAHTPRELELATGVAVVGTVPNFPRLSSGEAERGLTPFHPTEPGEVGSHAILKPILFVAGAAFTSTLLILAVVASGVLG